MLTAVVVNRCSNFEAASHHSFSDSFLLVIPKNNICNNMSFFFLIAKDSI